MLKYMQMCWSLDGVVPIEFRDRIYVILETVFQFIFLLAGVGICPITSFILFLLFTSKTFWLCTHWQRPEM